MNMQKITALCCLLLTSCCTRPHVDETLFEMPVTPKLAQYDKGPILKKVDADYLVTKELVNNAVLLTDYHKRLEKWKEEKNIR
jgi:hypothetical protein